MPKLRQPAALLALLLIISHRPTTSEAFPFGSRKCYQLSINGMLKHPNATKVTCGKKDVSCYEYYYPDVESNRIMYEAGCGKRYMEIQMQIKFQGIRGQADKECFKDYCNDSLMSELMNTGRVCYWAHGTVDYGETAVACLKGETKCYKDTMLGAKVETYFAGCGDCPSHTLYCSSCDSNFCNATEVSLPSQPAVKYVNAHSGTKSTNGSMDLAKEGFMVNSSRHNTKVQSTDYDYLRESASEGSDDAARPCPLSHWLLFASLVFLICKILGPD